MGTGGLGDTRYRIIMNPVILDPDKHLDIGQRCHPGMLLCRLKDNEKLKVVARKRRGSNT